MTKIPIRDAGVEAAFKAAGGPNALARLLNIKSPSVCGWPRVPAERVLQIETLTGGLVNRYVMRPDLYPSDLEQTDPHKKGFMRELLKDKPDDKKLSKEMVEVIGAMVASRIKRASD